MKIISIIAIVSAIYGYFVLHLNFGQIVGLLDDAIVEITSIVAFILTVLIYSEHWLLWLTIEILTI
ncbi:nicotinamide mononucleotide transporter [Francisella tularensis]|uniref:nicotinamide mononucleotide transporter n=1 Tax=Francisella tularensis TaxID=263 RepID=UPI002381C142|nr:nicotinamide mononucleotide transporter [Francisella tularensis]MDE4988267.1 hypothetical protein [Francisella tularensis subsp. holarctica]